MEKSNLQEDDTALKCIKTLLHDLDPIVQYLQDPLKHNRQTYCIHSKRWKWLVSAIPSSWCLRVADFAEILRLTGLEEILLFKILIQQKQKTLHFQTSLRLVDFYVRKGNIKRARQIGDRTLKLVLDAEEKNVYLTKCCLKALVTAYFDDSYLLINIIDELKKLSNSKNEMEMFRFYEGFAERLQHNSPKGLEIIKQTRISDIGFFEFRDAVSPRNSLNKIKDHFDKKWILKNYSNYKKLSDLMEKKGNNGSFAKREFKKTIKGFRKIILDNFYRGRYRHHVVIQVGLLCNWLMEKNDNEDVQKIGFDLVEKLRNAAIGINSNNFLNYALQANIHKQVKTCSAGVFDAIEERNQLAELLDQNKGGYRLQIALEGITALLELALENSKQQKLEFGKIVHELFTLSSATLTKFKSEQSVTLARAITDSISLQLEYFEVSLRALPFTGRQYCEQLETQLLHSLEIVDAIKEKPEIEIMSYLGKEFSDVSIGDDSSTLKKLEVAALVNLFGVYKILIFEERQVEKSADQIEKAMGVFDIVTSKLEENKELNELKIFGENESFSYAMLRVIFSELMLRKLNIETLDDNTQNEIKKRIISQIQKARSEFFISSASVEQDSLAQAEALCHFLHCSWNLYKLTSNITYMEGLSGPIRALSNYTQNNKGTFVRIRFLTSSVEIIKHFLEMSKDRVLVSKAATSQQRIIVEIVNAYLFLFPEIIQLIDDDQNRDLIIDRVLLNEIVNDIEIIWYQSISDFDFWFKGFFSVQRYAHQALIKSLYSHDTNLVIKASEVAKNPMVNTLYRLPILEQLVKVYANENSEIINLLNKTKRDLAILFSKSKIGRGNLFEVMDSVKNNYQSLLKEITPLLPKNARGFISQSIHPAKEVFEENQANLKLIINYDSYEGCLLVQIWWERQAVSLAFEKVHLGKISTTLDKYQEAVRESMVSAYLGECLTWEIDIEPFKIEENLALVNQYRKELDDLFWKPLLKQITERISSLPNMIEVYPDGPAWHFPFAGFTWSDGSYLGQLFPIVHLPSLSTKQQMGMLKKDKNTIGNQISIVRGKTNHIHESKSLSEAKKIHSVGGENSLIHNIDSLCTIDEFKRAINTEYLHIISHSELDTDNPLGGTFQLKDGEISALNLFESITGKGPSLVTFSSCWSGQYTGVDEFGVGPMIRSLVAQGVPSILAPTREVFQDVTELTITKFYEEIMKSKETPSKALLKARQGLIGTLWENPYFWEQFTLYSSE